MRVPPDAAQCVEQRESGQSCQCPMIDFLTLFGRWISPCRRWSAPGAVRNVFEEGLRDKWKAGLTEAQIVDAVEIDLLQPDC